MDMDAENLLAAIQGLYPQGAWSGIGNIFFGVMELCEDEITKAQARHPEHKDIVWRDGFKLLCPNVYVRDASEPVYRAHCAELLDRVAQGLDTTLGTRAEIMMGLSSSSLIAPLSHTATVLYARLFSKILPDAPIIYDLEALGAMDFDGTVETLLAELSKKCRDPGRKLARTKGK